MAVATSVAALAGCGSGTSTSSPTSAGSTTAPAAGSTASGKPIQVGVVTNLTGGAYATPEVKGGTQAAIDAINAKGGVGGRPLQAVFCDAQNDPTVTASCYQSAASNTSIVALTGVGTIYSQQSASVLMSSSLPSILPVPVSQYDLSGTTAFPLTGGSLLQFEGGGLAAVEGGAKKVAIVRNDISVADALDAGISQIVQKAGASVAARVKVAPTATDLSAAAAQVTQSNADAAVVVLPLSQASPFVVAARQGGYQGTIFIGGDQLSDSYLGNLGVAPGKLSELTVLPTASDTSTPGGAAFNKDMATYGQGTAVDDDSLGAWLSVEVLAQALAKASTPTRAGVAAALPQLTPDTQGLTLPISWAHPGPLASLGLGKVPQLGFNVGVATNGKWVWSGKIQALG